jgi:hypothetical protein
MVFPQAPGKSSLKPAFSRKSKVAVPKLKFWNSLNCQPKGLIEAVSFFAAGKKDTSG